MILNFSKTKKPLSISGSAFSAEGGRIVVKLKEALYGPDDMEWVDSEGGGISADCGLIHIKMFSDDADALCLTLVNRSERSISVEDISIEFPAASFTSLHPARDYRHLLHDGSLFPLSGVKSVHSAAPWAGEKQESGMVTVYSHKETKDALLIGSLPPFGSGYSVITTLHDSQHREGAFGVRIRFDFRQKLVPAASLKTSPLVMLGGGDGNALLEEYGKMMHSRISRPGKQNAVGWNSWDYYAGAVTEKDMEENAAVCRDTFGDKVQYMVIDEGWERMWGVWQTNWKFPEGLADHCRMVREAGYTPGIWTAPLMVCVYTSLYRDNPDWFVRDSSGNAHLRVVSYGTMAQLDITHPEVQDHLRGLFASLKEAGFAYFKCDFTQMVLDAEQFHDPTVGRADILRMLFTLIRETIGDESYLLACLAPFESVIGIADSFRITVDVHSYWSNIVRNCRVLFSRWWMSGTIGNVDPDFAIVRCSETTDDIQLNRLSMSPGSAHMTLEEAKVLAAAIYMTGGDVFLSDALAKLNDTGLDILQKIVEPLPAAAKPLNLFEQDGMTLPVLLAETEEEFIVSAFNLTDDPHTQTIETDFLNGQNRAVDFWTDENILIDGHLRLMLPPRSCRVLKIKR